MKDYKRKKLIWPFAIWTFFYLQLALGITAARTESELSPATTISPPTEVPRSGLLPPLTRTRNKIQEILAGKQSQLVVATIGDSWTDNNSTFYAPGYKCWAKDMADALHLTLGDAGSGWVGFGSSLGAVRGNISPEKISIPSFSAGWMTTQDSSSNGISAAPDISEVRSSKSGATVTISGITPCNTIELYYKVVAGSSIKYRFNGAPWVNIDSGSGSGIISLVGVPTGVWTLKIQIVAGEPVLHGLDIKKSGPGIRWHNLAVSGTSSAHWSKSAKESSWQRNLKGLAPDLVTILLATNDQLDPVAIFTTRMQILIASIRAAVPESDILLIAPAENGLTGRIPMTRYTSALAGLALTNHLAMLDLQPFFGPAFSEYEFNSPRALFMPDNLHPSIAGSKLISTTVINHVFGSPIVWGEAPPVWTPRRKTDGALSQNQNREPCPPPAVTQLPTRALPETTNESATQ